LRVLTTCRPTPRLSPPSSIGEIAEALRETRSARRPLIDGDRRSQSANLRMSSKRAVETIQR
jgi:hypothetical protein